MVAAIDEIRARQVIAAVSLEDERPLKANVAGIGRFQELGLLGQTAHIVFHARDLAVLINEVHLAVIISEE